MATGSGSFITENITVSNILCYIVFDSKIGTITTTTINISLSEYRNFNIMIKFGKNECCGHIPLHYCVWKKALHAVFDRVKTIFRSDKSTVKFASTAVTTFTASIKFIRKNANKKWWQHKKTLIWIEHERSLENQTLHWHEVDNRPSFSYCIFLNVFCLLHTTPSCPKPESELDKTQENVNSSSATTDECRLMLQLQDQPHSTLLGWALIEEKESR